MNKRDSRASPFPPAQRGSLLLGLGTELLPSTGLETRHFKRMYLVRGGSTSSSISAVESGSVAASGF